MTAVTTTTASDPAARRDTPLARRLAAEIAKSGPISIHAYMQRCLADPVDGYYITRSGIGRAGDFITAPEISQVFGELLGLWAAVVWQQMGAPQRINLIELGPGRGTLIADALRAARIVPGFLPALQLHLTEINPAFREAQAKALHPTAVRPTWHEAWPALDDAPTIVIANEFLDTIPGRQLEQDASGAWREVSVGLDETGHLAFVQGPPTPPPRAATLASPPEGTLVTETDFAPLAAELAARAPLAALFIDYGHATSAPGDTLQAVRNHVIEHPLTSPGEADLSLAVDFQALQAAFDTTKLIADGPTTQAEFLGRLGIMERASKLMAANPAQSNTIESGVSRLMAAPGMGTRFLSLGVRSRGLPPLPAFAP